MHVITVYNGDQLLHNELHTDTNTAWFQFELYCASYMPDWNELLKDQPDEFVENCSIKSGNISATFKTVR